jgi:hypothetical protein
MLPEELSLKFAARDAKPLVGEAVKSAMAGAYTVIQLDSVFTLLNPPGPFTVRVTE